MKKGWYKNPENPDEERWWTGSEWSSETRSGKGRDLQEAGKRSSEQDLRPRKRRRRPAEDSIAPPADDLAPPADDIATPADDTAPPKFDPVSQEYSQEVEEEEYSQEVEEEEYLQEVEEEEIEEEEYLQEFEEEEPEEEEYPQEVEEEEIEEEEGAGPAFVELPAANKNIGEEKVWETEEPKPTPKRKRSRRSRRAEKIAEDDFQSFEELEDPKAKEDVFASFEKEIVPDETVWEKPEKKDRKARPVRTKQIDKKKKKPDKKAAKEKDSSQTKPRSNKKEKSRPKKPQKTKHRPTRKPRSAKTKRQRASIAGAGRGLREKLSSMRREKSDEPSSLGIATKKFLPIAVGIVLVVGVAAVAGPLLEGGKEPPARSVQDTLSDQLAAKKKAARDPYPGVDRCIRTDGNVNSVLQEKNDNGEWEWKVIYVDQNYQLITVTLNSSPADAKQSAELAAASFLSTSGGSFSIEGPIKGLAGGETSELKTISQYMSELSACLADTEA